MGFACAHARFRAPSGPKLTRLFLGVFTLPTANTPAKYVKRRGSAQECVFFGVANQSVTCTPSFLPKPPFSGQFRRYLELFVRKTALTLGVPRVNPLKHHRSAIKVVQWIGNRGHRPGISKMWEKFAPYGRRTHRSRDAAHAQWLQTHCQWYPMGDVTTHNSRTDSRRIFKLGGGVEHVTLHVWLLTNVKGQRSKSQGHITYQQR